MVEQLAVRGPLRQVRDHQQGAVLTLAELVGHERVGAVLRESAASDDPSGSPSRIETAGSARTTSTAMPATTWASARHVGSGLPGAGAACTPLSMRAFSTRRRTCTPALLSFAGVHVLRRGEKARIESGVHAAPAPGSPLPTWRALAQVVAGIAVLVVLALPAVSMRLGLPDGSSEAVDSSQYRAYTLVADKFGEGRERHAPA